MHRFAPLLLALAGCATTDDSALDDTVITTTATAGEDQVVWNDGEVQLHGGGTWSEGSGVIHWTQVEGPVAAIDAADVADPYVDVQGVPHGSVLVFELSVSAESAETSTDRVAWTIRDRIDVAVQTGDPAVLPSDGARLLQRIVDVSTGVDAANTRFLDDLYQDEPIRYDPGRHSQFFRWRRPDTLPIVIGDGGRSLAVAVERGVQRNAAYGVDIIGSLQTGALAEHEQVFDRVLGWLLDRDESKLDDPANVRLVLLGDATVNRSRGWLATHHPNWTVEVCRDQADLLRCLADDVDLVITGSTELFEAQSVVPALRAAQDEGAALLYAHPHAWNAKPLTAQVLGLMDLEMQGPGGPGNYFAQDKADWTGADEMRDEQSRMSGLLRMVTAFRDDAFEFSVASCVGSCAEVDGYERQFGVGAGLVHELNGAWDRSAVDLFKTEGHNLQKLLVLFGDDLRADVIYPMDKDTTPTSTFLRSLYADHAALTVRETNPGQPDMGNFSRGDFGHVNPVDLTVTHVSKRNFRSTGAYALPGQTVRITRTDSEDVATHVFINTLRPAATHEMDAGRYLRPKFLQSAWVPVEPGQSVALTSAYGGPVQIAYGANEHTVTFEVEHVGQHPHWSSSEDDVRFEAGLAEGAYDWAEVSTPGFEVHSTLDKMRETVQRPEWGTLSELSAGMMRYVHYHPHVLAGFRGPGIDEVPAIHDFADRNGWTVRRIDLVKHMNADQASCGSGCSGNPYDAYWAFNPIGHGDIHELGHGLERSEFKFDGREAHATTNFYSYYTKYNYYLETDNDPACQKLPFREMFDKLVAAADSEDPFAAMHDDSSLNKWNRGVAMMLQAMMAAQAHGALEEGWMLLPRLHLLQREFVSAQKNDEAWSKARDNLGMSSFTRSEARSLSNNDFLLIAMSYVIERDFQDWFDMWGLQTTAAARAQVLGWELDAVARVYYASSADGYCYSLDQLEIAVHGDAEWVE
ncbi:MAG: hypothetical protein ACI9MC_000756 [Kiritimatiellia bacterium]|jgi:hypothetical protein